MARTARKKPVGKNIVILCDGTSNEIKSERTNVLRLFQCLDIKDGNTVFYDPGVGTVGAYSNWSWFLLKIKEIVGLAFGKGLDDNVLDAYQFLVENWEPGDRIYMFGFSRGAYTVRVLAGLVYTIGILTKQQANLNRYALNTLKSSSLKGDFENLAIYQETLNRRPVPIEFLGLWDSVSSVFQWIDGAFRIKNIGYTKTNTGVKCIRHALSIDERRRFFVHYPWLEGQKFTTTLPIEDGHWDKTLPDQDVLQAWFAGTHCDVGGGFKDQSSQVPKIAMEWLLREAVAPKDEPEASDLKIDEQKVLYFLGETPDDEGNYLTKPNPTADLYDSINKMWGWWIVEIFPKWKNFQWDNWRSWFEFTIPLGRRRTIPDDVPAVHDSVKIRQDETDYNPPNLPKNVTYVSTQPRPDTNDK